MVRRGKNSFEELATEYSDGPSYNRGGDIGFFQEGQMAQQFFKFVNKNKIGRIGLVETEFGFHIIKVTDKDDLAEHEKERISRVDLTEKTFVTIDGEDSKDFDDAVWSENKNNKTKIMVAVADVSFYIQKNDLLI